MVRMHMAKLMSDEQLAKPGLAEIDPQTLAGMIARLNGFGVEIVTVKCTGNAAGNIVVKSSVDKVTVARRNYNNNERAEIQIDGPAKIHFTTFQTQPRHTLLSRDVFTAARRCHQISLFLAGRF